MKISLITVSYNSEETIRETFESVRGQKIEGFELEYIHVDGLSNDATMEISKEFDDIITIRISEKDSGIYNAMNKGINMATGDVIGFLNSDDTFADSLVLNEIIKAFVSDKDVSIVYGDIDYTSLDGVIKRKWRTGVQESFRGGWHPPHPAFYAKRSLFSLHGSFDERLRIAADFDLMLRFMETTNAVASYLPSVFVKMKLGGESNKSFANIKRSNREILQSFKKYNIRPRFLYRELRWINKFSQYFRQ
jgi:glycosyltransferase involved in cell wall biosynthesis